MKHAAYIRSFLLYYRSQLNFCSLSDSLSSHLHDLLINIFSFRVCSCFAKFFSLSMICHFTRRCICIYSPLILFLGVCKLMCACMYIAVLLFPLIPALRAYLPCYLLLLTLEFLPVPPPYLYFYVLLKQIPSWFLLLLSGLFRCF